MINKTIEGRYHKTKKQKPFQNSWSINYQKPNYDALGDPHASYYFLNKSMRKHLKSLKKSIQRQGSFVEKKKIKNMIGQRIRVFDSANHTTKVQAYYFNMRSSSSIGSLRSARSGKQLLNQQTSQNPQKKQKRMPSQLEEKSKTLEVQLVVKKQKQKQKQKKKQRLQLPKIIPSVTPVKQIQKIQEIKPSQKQQNKINLLNKTEHNKFLKFLLEKKKKLSVQIPAKNQKQLQIKNQQNKPKEIKKQNQVKQN